MRILLHGKLKLTVESCDELYFFNREATKYVYFM